jgi:putative membrane protein
MAEDTATRDALAKDRTHLANERTLLAYVRTALALVVTGVGIVEIFASAAAAVIGWITALTGGVLMIVGIWRFRTMRTKLK